MDTQFAQQILVRVHIIRINKIPPWTLPVRIILIRILRCCPLAFRLQLQALLLGFSWASVVHKVGLSYRAVTTDRTTLILGRGRDGRQRVTREPERETTRLGASIT